MRRRNSRIELEAAYSAAAVAAAQGHAASSALDEPPADAPAGGISPADGPEPITSRGGKSKKSDGKPKTKDITRFLATAALMAGDEVDDGMLLNGAGQAQGKKAEADDVLTREKLKRNVKVAQAAQQQQAAAVKK